MTVKSVRKPSVIGGTMIIAGTSIGAGMLGLPTISAGMWFYWSILVLVGTWAVMLLSSQALLEVNLHYEPGASFDTLVKDTLGKKYNIINGISVAFVLYILLYAYFSAGASIVRHTLDAVIGWEPNERMAGLIFILILSLCVWFSTWLVDRLSLIMMLGMIITFVLSMSGMLTKIKAGFLHDAGGTGGESIFVLVALSTYLTSFCFHASVPSLVKYFGKDPVSINKCLKYGTTIALICYFTWILTADGNISRMQFKEVIAAGGNVGDLIKAAGTESGIFIKRMLEAFAALAVATSFLGAGLGLFDYISDLFKFGNTRTGRTSSAVVTFTPPAVAGLIWPKGFLVAIGWAGFAAAVWSVIIPAMMLYVSRKKFPDSSYRASGGKLAIPILIFYGAGTAICHILSVFKMLPEFK